MSYQLTQEEVEAFLFGMKAILNNPDFNLDRDLDILKYDKNRSSDSPYTYANALLLLDYDSSDVVDELRNLTTQQYSHNDLDNKKLDGTSFLIFFKVIKSHQLYIKIRVRTERRQIFCISFHLAEYPVDIAKLPYLF